MIFLTKLENEKQLQCLRSLRPIDDDFMRCLFKDNIPLVQLVLRIITGKYDLIITQCQTQKDMKRLAGARSVCLDAYAIDSTGKKYDLEIQRSGKGADPHRARYHSSVMDIENLNPSQQFHELPDTYTIFIMEKDLYHKGEPLYPIERINLATGLPFEDGEHILYVNGEYRGDSDLGKLMHDFSCTDASSMNFDLMAERTRYLKNDAKGVSEMCKVIEDLIVEECLEAHLEGIDEGRVKERKKIVKAMLEEGSMSIEKIAKITGLSLEEIKELEK